MNAPRLEINLDAIAYNTRVLVDRLAPKGIRVLGISKSTLGSPAVAAAMATGGASGFGDSRIENLARVRSADLALPLTLIRSPMVSQAAYVVRDAVTSFNTEATVLDALSGAAVRQNTTHAVVLMVELGDLREGIAVADVAELARTVGQRPGLRLAGLGTNLACQSGVVPDQTKMDVLSRLADEVETRLGGVLSVVSGGNSANLDWAMGTGDTGRIDELRLGESIMLGTDPLDGQPIAGLRTDAFTIVAEVIEAKVKPAQAWGTRAKTAFGYQPPRTGSGTVRQALLAIGRQDTDPDGLEPPDGVQVLGMSSDHLVVDLGDHHAAVGDEISFRPGYGALVRAATSPFVTAVEQHDLLLTEPGTLAG